MLQGVTLVKINYMSTNKIFIKEVSFISIPNSRFMPPSNSRFPRLGKFAQSGRLRNTGRTPGEGAREQREKVRGRSTLALCRCTIKVIVRHSRLRNVRLAVAIKRRKRRLNRSRVAELVFHSPDGYAGPSGTSGLRKNRRHS